jgi:hypothetical protein
VRAASPGVLRRRRVRHRTLAGLQLLHTLTQRFARVGELSARLVGEVLPGRVGLPAERDHAALAVVAERAGLLRLFLQELLTMLFIGRQIARLEGALDSGSLRSNECVPPAHR